MKFYLEAKLRIELRNWRWTSTAPTLGEEPLKRNMSVLCCAQFASRVGCLQRTVRLRRLGVFSIFLGYFRKSKANWHNVYVVGINRLMASLWSQWWATMRKHIPHANRNAEGTFHPRSVRLILLNSVLKNCSASRSLQVKCCPSNGVRFSRTFRAHHHE